MEEFTPTTLDNDIDICINNAARYSNRYAEAFELMKITGCRPVELFDHERWKIVDSNTVSLQPAKGNNLRYIESSLIPANILQSIEDGFIITACLSQSSLYRYFAITFPTRPLFVGNSIKQSPIGIYIFRHRAFKLKELELSDPTAVGAYFGEIDIKNTNGYINSVLYRS